jgi:hypothetical protein
MSAKGGKKEQNNEEVKMVLQKTFIPLCFRLPIHLEDPTAIKAVAPVMAFLVICSMCAIAIDAPRRVTTGITCSCGFNGRIHLGVALATPSEHAMVVLRMRARAAGTAWHLGAIHASKVTPAPAMLTLGNTRVGMSTPHSTCRGAKLEGLIDECLGIGAQLGIPEVKPDCCCIGAWGVAHDLRSARKVEGSSHRQCTHDLQNIGWLDREGSARDKVGNINDLKVRL